MGRIRGGVRDQEAEINPPTDPWIGLGLGKSCNVGGVGFGFFPPLLCSI